MKLHVCLEGRLAGSVEASRTQIHFTYHDQWLSRRGAYPLSHSLPLAPGVIAGAPVLNFLWGLLPDNEATLQAWARRFQVSARNPVALLANVGEDCAGAVQFVLEEQLDELLVVNAKKPQIDWLEERDFERRIAHLAQDAGAARESITEGQFSLSGAQPKTALFYDSRQDRWGVPRGRTPTTHILKPALSFQGFAENEYLCLTLARRAGLPAAHTSWSLIGGIPTLISERYDRVPVNGQWIRIHQEDCCQALSVHPAIKYENQGGPGFADIMRLLESSDDPEADRTRLMKTACLVYLLGATDAHAKNFSLLYAPGDERFSMRLAPLYDLASAWPYPRQIPRKKMKLAMQIGKHYRISEVQPRHFELLARACRYPADTALKFLEELAQTLPEEGRRIQEQLAPTTRFPAIVEELVDGLRDHCKSVLNQLARRPAAANARA